MNSHLRTIVAAPLAGEYLPLRQLAMYSGLSVRTLRGHLVDCVRPLPHYRIGGKILVRRADFDAWAVHFRASARKGIDGLVNDVIRGLE